MSRPRASSGAGTSERAAIEARFPDARAKGPSYETIVASRPNATTAHDVESERRIEEGDLVLIDAGCEHEGYAADITRMLPASGRSTPEQEAVCRVALSALRAATLRIRPAGCLKDVHDAAVDVLVTEDGHCVLTAAAPKSVETMCEHGEKGTPRPAGRASSKTARKAGKTEA
jgi:Xaa-Pro aminopeptidase